MPLNAVVDASVLVSAFLFPRSVPGLIVTLAGRGRFAMQLSPILLDEIRDALLSARLTKAYGHDESNVLAWLAELREIDAVFQGLLPDIGPACRDPDDDHVIATAVIIGADVIVTGDKDLLALGQFQAVRVLTPPTFQAELAPNQA